MQKIQQFYFNDIAEARQAASPYSVNYLTNRDAERDYFSPLSVATSFFVGDEYIFSNYMDNLCYSIHTPSTSSFYSETMMHKHSFFELIYIQRGSIGMKIEYNDFTYHTGDLCLLNRNTKHVETDIFDADICYLAIDPQFILRWPKDIHPLFYSRNMLERFFRDNLSEKAAYKKDYINFSILEENDIAAIFEELVQAFIQKRTGYQFDVFSSLSRFFSVLQDDRLYNMTYVNLEQSQEILVAEKVKHLIHASCGCMKRYELAAQLNYSGEYLSRVVKRYTGCTLKAYCQRIQMQEAARQLKSTQLPVSQIAASLGYENRTQFNHNFKKEYQMTPAQYRSGRSAEETDQSSHRITLPSPGAHGDASRR